MFFVKLHQSNRKRPQFTERLSDGFRRRGNLMKTNQYQLSDQVRSFQDSSTCNNNDILMVNFCRQTLMLPPSGAEFNGLNVIKAVTNFDTVKDIAQINTHGEFHDLGR